MLHIETELNISKDDTSLHVDTRLVRKSENKSSNQYLCIACNIPVYMFNE